jgi:uncharacterized protein (DUF1810 family)
MTDSSYNGFKNWNHWNVSLWINNDEGLYNLAKDYLNSGYTKDQSSRFIFELLKFQGFHKTPDGAPYSVSSIRSALVGM